MTPEQIERGKLAGRYYTDNDTLVAVHSGEGTQLHSQEAEYFGHRILLTNKAVSSDYLEWNRKGECVSVSFDSGTPDTLILADYDLCRMARGCTFAAQAKVENCVKCKEHEKGVPVG